MIDVVAAVIKKDNKYFIAQRNRQKHFAYYWEFPGGKVDPEDGLDNMEAITTGSSDQHLSNILGEEKGGLAYWVACIRECFEEAPMKNCRSRFSSCILNGYIYAMGGMGHEMTRLREAERFSVKDKRWEVIADMNEVRYNASCCSCDILNRLVSKKPEVFSI